MKTTMARENCGKREEEGRENKMREEIKFMWMPGKRPVKVPAIVPIRRARVSSKSIKL